MFDAFLGTRLTVAGYGVSGSAPAATTAGVAFLHRLERLDSSGRVDEARRDGPRVA